MLSLEERIKANKAEAEKLKAEMDAIEKQHKEKIRDAKRKVIIDKYNGYIDRCNALGTVEAINKLINEMCYPLYEQYRFKHPDIDLVDGIRCALNCFNFKDVTLLQYCFRCLVRVIANAEFSREDCFITGIDDDFDFFWPNYIENGVPNMETAL